MWSCAITKLVFTPQCAQVSLALQTGGFTTLLSLLQLGDPLEHSLWNTILGICLGDNDHDCLTKMRFADDVLLFARAASKKCCATSSTAQKRWDSKYIQERRKFSASKARTVEKKSRLTTSKSNYYQKKKVQNILARSNRRRPRSRIVFGLLGRHSANTNKS